MIWILIFVAGISTLAYLAAPFYLKKDSANDELSTYREALSNIEDKVKLEGADIEQLNKEKLQLEQRLLSYVAKDPLPRKASNKGWMAVCAATLFAGSLGIYTLIGSPNLSKAKNQKPATLSAPHAMSQNMQEVQHENDATMEQLIAGLETKLKAGDESPQSWGLYARSLMTLSRYEEAFKAYEKTLELTNNNPQVAAELESARAFAAQQGEQANMTQQPGPSRADIEAAQSMSQEDRAAMIEGMVEGLAAKLVDEPDNMQGWVRLLRARKVLGQESAAAKDIERLKSYFSQSPETVDVILNQSGWAP